MPRTPSSTPISNTPTDGRTNVGVSSNSIPTNNELDNNNEIPEHNTTIDNNINDSTSPTTSSIDTHLPPSTSKPEPTNIIKQMLAQEWNITAPREFQISAIKDIVFDKKDMFIIQGTSRGKSMVPLGAGTMLRGVVLTLVPLLGLGVDQVSKAVNLPSRVEAYHLDEMSDGNLEELEARLRHLPDTKHMQHSIIIYGSPKKINTTQWKSILNFLVENNLLSLFCIDEAHCVVTQGCSFRPEFKSAVQNTLSILQSGGKSKIPKLCMSATLDDYHQKKLRKVMSNPNKRKRGDDNEPDYTPDVISWGGMDRRTITLLCSTNAQPIQIIKKEATTAFKANKQRKVIVNCESKTAAEGTINKALEAAIKEADVDGVSIPFTGGDGIKLKYYLMQLFTGKIQQPNLVAMPGTQSMNCGVSSNHCWRGWAHGPPPTLFEMYQQMGRLDRRMNGSPGENVYHIILNLPLFINIYVRAMQLPDKDERQILKKQLFDVIRMLVIPEECYHVQLETALERPSDKQRLPCGNACSFCNNHIVSDSMSFSKSTLIHLLQHQVFYEGPVTAATILKCLTKPDNKKHHVSANAFSNSISPSRLFLLPPIKSCISYDLTNASSRNCTNAS